MPPRSTLIAENRELQVRLGEAEDLLRAIRSNEVDALVVQSARGPRIFTLQGLDADTNRVRGEMLAQVSDAVVAVDSDDRITYLNAAAENVYGVISSEVLGRTRSAIYVSRWLHPQDEAAANTALHEHGAWHGENIHVTRGGDEIHVESSITTLRNESVAQVGMLAVIRDVSERKKQEHKLLLSEIRYRRLFETAHDGVLIVDVTTGRIVDANPFMTLLLGYATDELIGKELFEIGLFKDKAESRKMFRELRRTTQVRYDNLPLETKDGRKQEVEVVANLYDENGRAVVQFNIRDITQRKQSEAHVKALLAEVNHRAKNLLAVVQAITLQTAKYGDSATYVQRLCARINGLAAGQDLLVKTQWQGVDLADLVESQLAHFKDLIGTRVFIDGPRLQLTSAAAQGIGMALHELVTNAAKYGALSTLAGRVRVAWQVAAAPEPAILMSWVEEGGPKVVQPTRKGFGGIVLGRLVEASVDGVAQVTYRESGLTWNLQAPIKNTYEATRVAR